MDIVLVWNEHTIQSDKCLDNEDKTKLEAYLYHDLAASAAKRHLSKVKLEL